MISDILQDHGMGKGISGADRKALIDIANAADINQSVVKTDIANGLNTLSTDMSLGLTATSTWADIRAAIPLVKNGKKWATGSGNVDYTANTTKSVVISGLNFKPSIVLIFPSNGYGAFRWGTKFLNNGGQNHMVADIVLNTSAFTINFYSVATSTGTFEWIAFE
ncbi:hypothetical protein A616_27980 [Brevibacillus brevis X23]|nr:hypothetical protein A616_27980 [Brevibacillus brevis X23]